MARVLRMPGLSASDTTGVLAEWLVAEDAAFADADALATIETDKALVDVEAEGGGVVLKTLVPPGSQVDVGAPIAVLADPGASEWQVAPAPNSASMATAMGIAAGMTIR